MSAKRQPLTRPVATLSPSDGARGSVTDTLCTRCGLCCDGSLFADVELADADEAAALEVLGLAVEEDEGDGGLLLQPCAALKGKRCSIYAHRPGCCRTFECKLLQDARRGEVTVDAAREKIAEALSRIQQIKKLIVQLGGDPVQLPLQECCDEVLAGEDEKGSGRNRKRDELEAAMSGLERFIRTTFLGNGRASGA